MVSYDLRGNATHETESFDRATARSESRTLVPWAANPSLSVALAGRTVDKVTFASVTNHFEFDALGQRISATNGRGNTTSYSYDANGGLSSIADAAGNTTAFIHDAAGRTIETIDALGHSICKVFDATDRTIAKWGATYPVVYAYDAYGRTIALATTRDTNFVLSAESIPDLSNPPEALDVTRWDYDQATGLLLDKRYADGKGPSYAYSSEGLLARRTWARGVTTDFVYDDFDSLRSKTYSDGTPAVSLRYDAQGRPLEAICEGVSTNVYAYDQYGQITNEIQNGTALARSYDSFGRPTGYCIGDGLAEGSAVSYAYDAEGRFSAVSSGTNTFEYSYLPGSSLVSGMTANTGHAWDRIYEPNRDLIATVHNRYENRTISRFDYTNDEIGRRVTRVDSGESISASAFERYTYNDRSELIGSQRFYGADVLDCAHPVPDCSFGYSYDPIGNRLSSSEIIDGMPVVTIYESNELNQYIQTSNVISATEFEYDNDGNLTFDGRFRYTWNGENRMIRAEESFTPTNRMPSVLTCAYDPQGRMTAKNLVGMNDINRTFLWDGYNIIRETENSISTYNIWGLDQDGTMHACGGVGGLLLVTKFSDSYVVFFDANGNASDYVSVHGRLAKHYLYSPFGKQLMVGGESFSHQFNTKPFCNVLDTLEYQYRHYNPNLGKWHVRDFLNERASLNLTAFCFNRPTFVFDLLGLKGLRDSVDGETIVWNYDIYYPGEVLITEDKGTIPIKYVDREDNEHVMGIAQFDIVRLPCSSAGGVSIQNVTWKTPPGADLAFEDGISTEDRLRGIITSVIQTFRASALGMSLSLFSWDFSLMLEPPDSFPLQDCTIDNGDGTITAGRKTSSRYEIVALVTEKSGNLGLPDLKMMKGPELPLKKGTVKFARAYVRVEGPCCPCEETK